MDFRRVDIAKQKAYDLLRDWIKLVARHTNPDQDISELLGWLWKLKPATPDPKTGLVPCGCGGKAVIHHDWSEGNKDWVYGVACDECDIGFYCVYDHFEAVTRWNTAMGYNA